MIVLDNRFDTVNMYVVEDGNTPPKVIGFKEASARAIQGYISGRTTHLKKNDETLLINIQQLRVPNKTFIRTVDVGRKKSEWLAVRGFVIFSADVYAGDGKGFYRKLFSIYKKNVPLHIGKGNRAEYIG